MPVFGKLKDKTVSTSKRLVGAEELVGGTKENYKVLKNIVLANTTKYVPEETEFTINNKQLAEAQQGYKKLFFMFGGISVFALLYLLANLIMRNWSLVFLSAAFLLLCLALTFRYHFWLYQIKKRVLGCDFSDWYQDEILKGKAKKLPPQTQKRTEK